MMHATVRGPLSDRIDAASNNRHFRANSQLFTLTYCCCCTSQGLRGAVARMHWRGVQRGGGGNGTEKAWSTRARPPRISRGDGAMMSSRGEAGRRDDDRNGDSGTRRAAARSRSVSVDTICTSQRGHNSAGASRGTLRGPEAGSRSALPCRGAARGGRSNEWGVPWSSCVQVGLPRLGGGAAHLSPMRRRARRSDMRREICARSAFRLPALDFRPRANPVARCPLA